MALNPQLINGPDYPYPANKGIEYTYMKADNVKLKLNLPNKTIKECGLLYLTSSRLVFIKNPNRKTNANFHGIEMPLNLVDIDKLNQPLFCATFISGTVKPLVGDPNSLPSSCTWNATFLDGHVERFFSTLLHVHETAKKNKTCENMNPPQESFAFSNSAYIDPNDPLHVYINEPINPNMYQPQNFSHNHYVPVTNANINNSSYPNNPMGGSYGNAANATNTNASVPYPLVSVNDQASLCNNNTNPGGNNMMSYPSHNNVPFHNSACPPPNVPHGTQGRNPQYMQQPLANYGQGNYNSQRQAMYMQPGQIGYTYGLQNYGQQPCPPVNNEMPNYMQNSGYNNPGKMGYPDQTRTNGTQQ